MLDETVVAAATRPVAGDGFVGLRHYALVALLLVGAANIGDRMVLSLMLDPIGREFHVSDAALGLLAGSVFALFYAIFSIPVGFASDRLNRRNIVAGAAALFGLMTMACGLAAQFWQLVVARALMSIGQSGTEAPSYAMTADLYSPNQRATAVAVLQSGGSLGLLVGLFCSGLLLQHLGWRTTFVIAGLPAVLLSVVLITTVREPVRGHSEGAHAGAAPPLMTVAQLIVRQCALVLLIVGVALACTGAYGLVSFLPTFLARSHGLTPVQVGLIVALLFGAVGGAGLLIAGKLSDRLATRNVKWNLWLPSLSLIVGGTLVPVLLFAPTLAMALAAGVPAIFLNSMFYGPTFALTQSLVPIAMRATTTAILLFILNIVGAGLGPLLVGWVSDVVRVATGDDGLRWALAVVSTGHILGGICFAIAAQFLSADLARVRMHDPAAAEIAPFAK